MQIIYSNPIHAKSVGIEYTELFQFQLFSIPIRVSCLKQFLFIFLIKTKISYNFQMILKHLIMLSLRIYLRYSLILQKVVDTNNNFIKDFIWFLSN